MLRSPLERIAPDMPGILIVSGERISVGHVVVGMEASVKNDRSRPERTYKKNQMMLRRKNHYQKLHLCRIVIIESGSPVMVVMAEWSPAFTWQHHGLDNLVSEFGVHLTPVKI